MRATVVISLAVLSASCIWTGAVPAHASDAPLSIASTAPFAQLIEDKLPPGKWHLYHVDSSASGYELDYFSPEGLSKSRGVISVWLTQLMFIQMKAITGGDGMGFTRREFLEGIDCRNRLSEVQAGKWSTGDGQLSGSIRTSIWSPVEPGDQTFEYFCHLRK